MLVHPNHILHHVQVKFASWLSYNLTTLSTELENLIVVGLKLQYKYFDGFGIL
jgi:hypothetical protein